MHGPKFIEKLEDAKAANRKRLAAAYVMESKPKSKLQQQTLTGGTGIATNRVTKEKMRDLVTNHVINDLKSVRSIESESFIAIVKAGCSKYSMSRKTLVKRIDKKMKRMKNNLKQQLKSINHVCTTVDIWSSRQRSFIGATCHWLDKDELTRRSGVLAFRRFKGEHNYKNIATEISNIHAEYELKTSKITHVVTDNGSNFLKAFREYGKQDNHVTTEETSSDNDEDADGENLPLPEIESSENSDNEESEHINTETTQLTISEILTHADEANFNETNVIYLPRHLPCAAHTLNLLASKDADAAIANDAEYKKLYRSVTAKCTSLSNSVHRSCKSAESAQEILGRTIPKPNSTRWNSEFDCLRTINDLKDNINQLMEEIKLPQFKPEEFDFLSEWVLVMQPVAIALDMLQGDANMEAYFGAILPTVLQLYKQLENLEGCTKYCDPLIMALKHGLKARFEHLISFQAAKRSAKNYIVAAVSHPFFRLRWLQQEDKDAAQDLFLRELCASHRAELTANKSTTNSDLQAVSSQAQPQRSVPAPASDEDSKPQQIHKFFNFQVSSAAKDDHASVRAEGHAYLENDTFTNDFSVLQKYPRVLKLFIQTNTTVPSSAPVERLFSSAGLIFLPRRNRLSDKLFEQLLLLKKNAFVAD